MPRKLQGGLCSALKKLLLERLKQSQGCNSLCCPRISLHAVAGSMHFKLNYVKRAKVKWPFTSKRDQKGTGSNRRGTARMPTSKLDKFLHLPTNLLYLERFLLLSLKQSSPSPSQALGKAGTSLAPSSLTFNNAHYKNLR